MNVLQRHLDLYWEARTKWVQISDDYNQLCAMHTTTDGVLSLAPKVVEAAQKERERLYAQSVAAGMETIEAAKKLRDQVQLLERCYMLVPVMGDLRHDDEAVSLGRAMVELARLVPEKRSKFEKSAADVLKVRAAMEAVSFLEVVRAAVPFTENDNPEEFKHTLKLWAYDREGASIEVCYAYLVSFAMHSATNANPLNAMRMALETVMAAAHTRLQSTKRELRQYVEPLAKDDSLKRLLKHLNPEEREFLLTVLEDSGHLPKPTKPRPLPTKVPVISDNNVAAVAFDFEGEVEALLTKLGIPWSTDDQ